MEFRYKYAAQCLLAGLILTFPNTSSSLQAQNANSRNEVRREIARKGGYSLRITLLDSEVQDPLLMANCQLLPIGAYMTTGLDGTAQFENIPEGEWTLVVSYVGYETLKTTITVKGNTANTFKMQPQSLALKNVEVLARKNEAGEATSSTIGRQAIDHLQANSLADIVQLIPGQLMGNVDLTSQRNLQLRTLVNNNTSAFGSSVVLDGVPLSNNAALSHGGFSATAFVGTDLRQISADNIEAVEVIRGIPSAEYGDLTSGMMVVRSKVGVTPWQVKAKINPGTQSYSIGKGIRLDRLGALNFSLDYAKAWGDPRAKTRSFDRYTGSIGWGYDINRNWDITTKMRFAQGKDWSGNDPDAIDDGTSSKNISQALSLTHNGKIALHKRFARTINYTFGLSFNENTSRQTTYVGSGLQPILTATESGYYSVPYESTSYLASGGTKSRPGNVFAKVSNSFFIKAGKTRQSFKMGVEYRFDWNNGRGYYNDDDRYPLTPNENGRPRAYSDIPSLHQFSAYAEDNFRWEINDINLLKVQLGARFTSQQMFRDEATYALSPRINASFAITDWMEVRGGYGLNSKTPGMDYLYPDRKYADILAASYMPQDGSQQILIYHTNVYEVKRNKGLKNATTTKVEAGINFKFPWGGNLDLIGYIDRTPKGFGNESEFVTYYNDLYSQSQIDALIAAGKTATTQSVPVKAPVDPTLHHLYYMTTGKVGNTNSATNRGLEMEFDLGKIEAIHTAFSLSGAYQETKTWSNNLTTAAVRTALLTNDYTAYGLTPFRVVYPSGLDYMKYRRFLNTLRVVTHIPMLKMVASYTAQAIWYDWNHSYTADKQPIGWIVDDGTGTGNVVRHEITDPMRNGYITRDGRYSETSGFAISELGVTYTDSEPSKSPITWNLQARLTKELGKLGGFSLYVNNCLFYEPYMKGNKTSSRTQRNTGSFQFGAELYFNL